MDDFEGLLSSDYGFKPQGKSVPMSSKPPSSNRSTTSSLNFDLGSHTSSSFSDSIFKSKPTEDSRTHDVLGDIFGAPSGQAEKSGRAGADPSFDFESMFNSGSNSSSAPVYDKPVYDDDIFEGVPGMKSAAAFGMKYDNVFEPISITSPSRRDAASSGFDDLLDGLGNRETQQPESKKEDPVVPAFDDLIPGFAGSSLSGRPIPKSTWSSEPMATSHKTMDDPFKAPGSAPTPAVSSSGAFIDPFEEFSVFNKPGSAKADVLPSGVDGFDPFDGLGQFIPSSSPDNTTTVKDRNPLMTDQSYSNSQRHNDREHSDHISQKTVPVVDDLESNQNAFNMSSPAGGFSASINSEEMHNSYEANVTAETSSGYEKDVDTSDTVWLTVSDIPLFTQPTKAPPPARPPPPRPARAPKVCSSSFGSRSARKVNEFSSFTNPTKHFDIASLNNKDRPAAIDDLENFARGRSHGSNIDDHVNWASGEDIDMLSDAAASAEAMKEAMDRAEAKFRHAKEVRERENSKASRIIESVKLEKEENWLDTEERALREKERLEQESLLREREEKERERMRIEKEREREREEKEREQQRLEKERERAREIERERARQAVERANREARERAAAEARLKAERAAVQKANAEARERAERAAVLRAQAEARERAAAEARERAEKVAAEAKEREVRERAAEARARAEKTERAATEAKEKETRERAAEARRRAERAAVERAAAEARERAAAEARERAAASARAKQQSSDNDLESFFSSGRASSAPRPRTNYSDPVPDAQFPSRPEVVRTSNSNQSMKKASSSTNIVDDLSSIFGGVSTSGEFQDVEGESEERRRARLERHQRTQERAAKALAEKNQRDLQAQREQAERHRIAESLDVEIKRWAAGKEGNLRALLSTLQYVLWPECGWQPISLTDLITAAAVKKVYRKATLCIHPDKVQQKGANLQQKYIAEKVFDLLKVCGNLDYLKYATLFIVKYYYF
ncbi:hypothetical protein SAY86_017325 [Trapa natans]|uniref:Auxilin-related protein 2 n=1 Tax=Trapa natans TaxID=22666 RepID=A0AAN7R7B4_TRANT|nr:hypothetical protein SAY86_017325 [Trapa natans]